MVLCERSWSASLWPQGLGASEQIRWSVACWAKMAAAVDCMQQGPGMADVLGTVEVALLCEEGNLGQQVGWLLCFVGAASRLERGSWEAEKGTMTW